MKTFEDFFPGLLPTTYFDDLKLELQKDGSERSRVFLALINMNEEYEKSLDELVEDYVHVDELTEANNRIEELEAEVKRLRSIPLTI